MSWNPLDLYGPEFLVFYSVVCVITYVFMHWLMNHQENQWEVPTLKMNDPYEIAYLRGGENETLRIAALSLVDRGLLKAKDSTLEKKTADADQYARRPLEKAILKKFETPKDASEMFGAGGEIKSACDAYRNSLGQKKLIVSGDVWAQRTPIFLFALLIGVGLAATKIAVALSRGRHNILFLIGLAVVFTWFVVKRFRKERTALGDRVLADLTTLFSGLKKRGKKIKAGGEMNEAALLASIFGISALSSSQFPFTKKLFPKPSDTGSTCGSSSSSCGSSGGSSCGGGGCGGGCGGCGS